MTPPGEDVTIGELARGIAALERRMNEGFGRVNQRLDGLQFVSRDVYDVQMRGVEGRLNDLEDSKTWMVRAVASAFLFPVAVAIVVGLLVTR